MIQLEINMSIHDNIDHKLAGITGKKVYSIELGARAFDLFQAEIRKAKKQCFLAPEQYYRGIKIIRVNGDKDLIEIRYH